MAASTLSREVSLAVLLRLDPEDLRYELLRRNITPAGDSTKESLIAQLGDEMVKEYFNQQASSTSLRNNTGNTPMQEEPTRTEETSEARPTEETPVAEEGAAAAEEEETDDKEPTEAQGRSYVGVKETRDDGQMQKPSDKSLDTNPSPSVTVRRKQTEDPNTGPSTQRTNTSEETDIIDLTSDLITPVRQSAQEHLIAQLFGDEQASSLNLGNSTRNTPTQEEPTGTEETSEARPAKETPFGAKGTTDAEEMETDDKEPTEEKGKSYVGVKETRDDGQLGTNSNPSPSETGKRKQAEDPNTGPSIKRTTQVKKET
ncbi:hypothetical protein Bbelb_013300 [Branchiostoma belcheri]|nr:hypothetical protein Bbelb_013300 [Branchiostoma belcheri]